VIAAEALAEVRSRHELVAFIESAGVTLRRRGRDLVGLCPFHNDSEPSLSVSPAKQYWCCLGACSAGGKKLGGDVIEFARRLWRVSFHETVARLGGEQVAQLASERPKLRVVKKTGGEGDPRPGVDLLPQVAAYYHQTLSSSLPAKHYLMGRGITRADVISALQIGYADGSLMERAPEGSETWNALAARGVITGRGELMCGCITVPLRDVDGNIVGLYGRAIERDLSTSTFPDGDGVW
jgi:DNA primase